MAVDLESGGRLELVRDYVGSTPDDDVLYEYAETLDYWQEVAIRVLERRLADANSGNATTSFTLTGVLSTGMKAPDLDVIRDQIAFLLRSLDAEKNGTPLTLGGNTTGRMVRSDRRR